MRILELKMYELLHLELKSILTKIVEKARPELKGVSGLSMHEFTNHPSDQEGYFFGVFIDFRYVDGKEFKYDNIEVPASVLYSYMEDSSRD